MSGARRLSHTARDRGGGLDSATLGRRRLARTATLDTRTLRASWLPGGRGGIKVTGRLGVEVRAFASGAGAWLVARDGDSVADGPAAGLAAVASAADDAEEHHAAIYRRPDAGRGVILPTGVVGCSACATFRRLPRATGVGELAPTGRRVSSRRQPTRRSSRRVAWRGSEVVSTDGSRYLLSEAGGLDGHFETRRGAICVVARVTDSAAPYRSSTSPIRS